MFSDTIFSNKESYHVYINYRMKLLWEQFQQQQKWMLNSMVKASKVGTDRHLLMMYL